MFSVRVGNESQGWQKIGLRISNIAHTYTYTRISHIAHTSHTHMPCLLSVCIFSVTWFARALKFPFPNHVISINYGDIKALTFNSHFQSSTRTFKVLTRTFKVQFALSKFNSHFESSISHFQSSTRTFKVLTRTFKVQFALSKFNSHFESSISHFQSSTRNS